MSTNTSSGITYLIHLHKEGNIDDNALSTALNALQLKLLSQKKRSDKKKKKRRQERKYAELLAEKDHK